MVFAVLRDVREDEEMAYNCFENFQLKCELFSRVSSLEPKTD